MTDAQLRYLLSVNDRDVKEARKNVLAMNKAIGSTATDADKGAKGMDRFNDRGRKGTMIMGGLGKAGKLAAVGLAGLAVAGGAAGAKMIGLASDAAEVDSKMKVVFGKTLPGLNKELDAFASKTGASRYELRQQAADLGALLRPLAGSQKAAADMSSQFVKLATDLGSFNNVPTADALLAIRSGLVGEAEPLRRFGVLLNEAAIRQEALRLGLIKGKEEMSEQEKVQARASLIMKQTTLAQGDAARTAGGMANQLKMLRNNVVDAATSIGIKLIPIALQAVQAFNRHWPEIERITGMVFRALGTGWTRYGEPTFRAIAAGTTWLVNTARQHWPRIREAAESVMRWYRSTLQPTITSVVNTISELWDRFGGKITAVARASFGILKTIVEGGLRTAKAAIDTILAVLRGDWQKAWEGLKTIVKTVLGTLASVARQAITNLLPALAGLGWDIVRGIAKGITDGAGSIIRRAIEWAADQIPGWAKKVLGISSPSRRMAAEVGIPISEGIAKGMMSGAVKVNQAMVDLANGALERARTAVQTKMGTFGSYLSQAFGQRQSGAQTPAERRLAEIDARRRADQLRRAVLDSEGAYNRAVVDEREFAPDKDMAKADIARRRQELRDAVVEAERQMAQAREDVLIAKLQETAEKERKVLEGRQFVERQQFDARLAGLQRYLESSEATADGATKRINQLLRDFGIDLADLGLTTGKMFARGLRNSIPAVVAAAVDLRSSARDAKIVNTASEKQAAAEKAAAAAAAARASTVASPTSGAGSAGSLTGSLVDIGRQLQRLGFGVAEHPAFGGVDPVHRTGSYHYAGRAIDVNWPGGGPTELSKLQAAYNSLRARGGFAELLIEDAGRANQHLHVALERGGIVAGRLLGDTGAAAGRREAVVPLETEHGRQALAAALRDAMGPAGPTVKIDTVNVRSDDDIHAIGSAAWRALAIR